MNASDDKEMGKAIHEEDTITLAGGKWAVGINESPFYRHDQVRSAAVHPLGMTKWEAIRILKNIETDIYGRIAIRKVIDALSIPPIFNPWVKTSDRLPTEQETRNGVVVISGGQGWFSVQSPKVLEMYPQYYPHWMAIPNLPKVAP